MSAKCIREILDRAGKMGATFTEREAGKMFRDIQRLEAKYLSEQNDPQAYLYEELKAKSPEAAARGEALREKLRRLSPEDRLREHARIAFEDAVAEKKEALRRHYLQVQKNASIAGQIEAAPEGKRIKALNEVVFRVEHRKNAIVELDMADMADAVEKYHKTLGYKMTREDALNIVREIETPGSTKDANARTLADVWKKGREAARQRKNSAGADVGKLKDWIMPQSWDAQGLKTKGLNVAERLKLHTPTTSKMERDALYLKAKLAFVDDAMKHIDAKRYWDENTGRYLDEGELREAMGYAWETITTGGLNEPVTTVQGRGALAKRLGAHRELHFKNADSWYAMTEKYGEKDVFTLMTSRIREDAKNIAILETFGPNPRTGHDAALALARHGDSRESTVGFKEWMSKNYFAELYGDNNVPASNLAANAMMGLRQWLVAAKLGGILLSQLNDIGTYAAIARTDGLGMGKALSLALKSLNPASKADQALARRHGILAQSIINDVAQRYGETVKGTSITSRLAHATVKLSGGEWWTNGMKRAYQTLIGTHLADARGTEFDALAPAFKTMFDRYGIGAKEWDVIRQVEPVEIMGERVVTPTAIKLLGEGPEFREAALKVAEMMGEEADIAVVTPGLRERAMIKAGTKPGTLSGELVRSLALFKTFSVTMMTKVLPRIFNRESLSTARGAGIAAQFAVSMIILGAASYQLKEIAKGRNPRDMADPEFWGSAAAQSGGLGIFGDFMFSDVNRFGGGLTNTILGPVGGLVEDASKLTLGNIHQAARGKETQAGAETIQFAKDYTPGINLWYTRTALDHLMFYQLQEAANPGYLRRMRQRVEDQNNQSFWWNPEDTLPGGR